MQSTLARKPAICSSARSCWSSTLHISNHCDISILKRSEWRGFACGNTQRTVGKSTGNVRSFSGPVASHSKNSGINSCASLSRPCKTMIVWVWEWPVAGPTTSGEDIIAQMVLFTQIKIWLRWSIYFYSHSQRPTASNTTTSPFSFEAWPVFQLCCLSIHSINTATQSA